MRNYVQIYMNCVTPRAVMGSGIHKITTDKSKWGLKKKNPSLDLPHCRQTLYCLSLQGRYAGKSTGVDFYVLLQGIFLTQGSNPCLLHYRWILYHWDNRKAHNWLYLKLIGNIFALLSPLEIVLKNHIQWCILSSTFC